MESEVFFNLVALLIPFATLSFLVYLLYLVVLNNFKATARNFVADTILQFSEEGREWFTLIKTQQTPEVEVEKKPSLFSNLFSNSALLTTFIPTVTSLISQFGSFGNNSAILTALANISRVQQDTNNTLITLAEVINDLKKEKVVVKNEPTNIFECKPA